MKIRNWHIVTGLLIAIILFLRFFVRPATIREKCSKGTELKSGLSPNAYYRLCLAKYGMKPEDLHNNF